LARTAWMAWLPDNGAKSRAEIRQRQKALQLMGWIFRHPACA
jgi:hypothetical protein